MKPYERSITDHVPPTPKQPRVWPWVALVFAAAAAAAWWLTR